MDKSLNIALKNEVYQLTSTNESIYEAIEEYAHKGYWYLDLNAKTNWWANPRFWDSLGFSFSDGETDAPLPALEEVLLPDDLTALLQTIEQLSKEDSFLLTLKYRHKNNQHLSFAVHAKIIRDKAGKAARLLALHNKSKNQPFFVNELYNQVLYSIHEGYQLTDTGNILDANDSFCKLIGYTRGELLTMNLTHLAAELTPDQVQDFINKVLAKNGGTISTKARTKDGRLVDIEIRTTLIDHNGKPLLASFVRDVTEQLRTNERLEIALQQYSSHRNNSPLGTVEYTKDLIVTQWSRQCEEIFEWTADEILSANISAFNLIYEDDLDATTNVALDLMSGKVDGNVSLNRNYTKSGKIITCIWYNSAIKNEKGEVISIISLVQDVTHQKEIEYKLVENERALDVFFNNSLYGFFFMMLDEPVAWDDTVDKKKALAYVFEHQRITKINRAMLSQYGAQEKEFLDLTPKDFFDHDIDYGKTVWKELFDNGSLKVDTLEKRFDGSTFWVEGEYVCLYNSAGEITGHFGIQYDVTEKKEAELALTASEEKLKEAQKMAKMGDSTINLITGEFLASEGLLELVRVENMEGPELKKWLDAAQHPEDSGKLESCVRNCLANKQEVIPPVEYRMTRKDGILIWVRTQGKIIYENEKPSTIFFTTQDTSRSKAVEEQIKASELRFRSLIENSKDGLVILSVDGNIDYISPSIAGILGYQDSEMVGIDLEKMVHPEDIEGLINAFHLALQQPTTPITGLLYRARHKQGNWRWMEGSLTNFLEIPHIGGVVNNFHDVTHRLENSNLLKKVNNQLKAAQKIAHLGYWEWNWKEETVFWSEELYAICKTDKIPSEAALFAAIHPEDQPTFTAYRKRLSEEKSETTIEFRFLIGKDVRIFMVRTLPLLDRRGKVIGLEGTVQDITERKEREQEILRLSTFPSENPNPVLRVLKDYTISYSNKASQPILVSKISGKAPKLPEQLRNFVKQTFDGSEILRAEFSVGGITYSFTSARSQQGDYVNLYGLDISPQKEIEKALRDSEYLLNEVGRIAKIGGWELDPETGEGTWTREVAEIHDLPFGTEAGLELGLSFYLPSSRSILEKAINDAFQLGKAYDLELEIITAKGNRKWVRTIGIPLLTDDGKVKLRGSFQDITALKNAKDNILLEKELSDNIINSLPGAFYLYTQEGEFLRWNKNLEEVTGYTAEEISTMHPIQFFHDSEKELLTEKIENVFVAGEDSVDAHFLTKSDQMIPYYFTGKAISYDGETCLMGVGIDTSERKKALEALKHSEEQYRSLFENMNEGFALCEMVYEKGKAVDFTYIQVNKAFEDITGLKKPVGKKVSELIPGVVQANQEEIALLSRVCETGIPERFEVKVEGLNVWLSSSVFSPKKGFFVSMFQDVTERKLAAIAVESSEQRFRALVEQSLTGIYIFEKGKFIYVNDHFADMFGYEVDEVLTTLKPTDVLTQSEYSRSSDLIDKRLTGELDFVHYVAKGLKKDGTTIWVEIHGSKIDLQGKDVITGTVLDITDRINSEQAMKELLETTTNQNIRLKDFSFITSHNIRSSVSNILGLTELLILDPTNAEYLRMLRTSTEKLDTTIRNINELIHFENDLGEKGLIEYNILQSVNNVLAQNNQIIKEQGLDIRTTVEKHLSIRCIPAYLDSILQNLVTNAIKYGTTERSNIIEINGLKVRDKIELQIKDYGSGIDLDRFKDKLFKIGSRFHSSSEGQGLGLYMSKRQIEAMGGDIEVESQPGKGTTFKVYFNAKGPENFFDR
ncbi:PAS domain S-box protein [uncultured Imperialibacter sp.]|uniref:PAS domain S-box protein n=1 Tax=uncultured Imperialibacter sp. TaxID=1672639 RepID=UPI0030D8AFC7|tara:strand:+ start:2681 stop:7960 length:5280 start_codon:yes stop_codon:yes gene_type:complete